MKKEDVVFLNFPDGGLRNLLQKHWIDRRPYFRSPFTLDDRPQVDDTLLPNIEFNGEDVKREIEKLLRTFIHRSSQWLIREINTPIIVQRTFLLAKSLKAYRKNYPTA